MATKFDLSGQPTKYASKSFVVGFLPLVFIFIWFLLNFLVKKSPSQFSMPNSQQSVATVIFGCGLLFLGIHFGMLTDPVGQEGFIKFFTFPYSLS